MLKSTKTRPPGPKMKDMDLTWWIICQCTEVPASTSPLWCSTYWTGALYKRWELIQFHKNKNMTFLSTSETLCPLSVALFSQIASESASSFSFGDRPQIFPLLHSRRWQGWASPPPEINGRCPRPSREFNFCDAVAQTQATSLMNNP